MDRRLDKRFISVQEEVRVCSGVGCRAWSSEKIARELAELQEIFGETGYKVSQVPCMKKCGGGASIQITSCERIQKFRKPEDALDVLVPERMVSSLIII